MVAAFLEFPAIMLHRRSGQGLRIHLTAAPDPVAKAINGDHCPDDEHTQCSLEEPFSWSDKAPARNSYKYQCCANAGNDLRTCAGAQLARPSVDHGLHIYLQRNEFLRLPDESRIFGSEFFS